VLAHLLADHIVVAEGELVSVDFVLVRPLLDHEKAVPGQRPHKRPHSHHGGTQRLPRVIRTGRALDLVLTGRTIQAPEAKSMGLITEIVGPGAHVNRALELAEEIAAHPRATTNSDRRALLEGETLPLAQGLALEADLGRAQLTTAQEGARRFAQRK